jgi:hypothetical protein
MDWMSVQLQRMRKFLKTKGSGKNPRRELLELLETIHGWGLGNLHLFVASRSEYDIEFSLKGILQSPRTQVLDMATLSHATKVSHDIGHFIDKELERGKFEGLSNDLKTTVKKALIDKADGVYVIIAQP